jgi:hypothetical protein
VAELLAQLGGGRVTLVGGGGTSPTKYGAFNWRQ